MNKTFENKEKFPSKSLLCKSNWYLAFPLYGLCVCRLARICNCQLPQSATLWNGFKTIVKLILVIPSDRFNDHRKIIFLVYFWSRIFGILFRNSIRTSEITQYLENYIEKNQLNCAKRRKRNKEVHLIWLTLEFVFPFDASSLVTSPE